MSSHRPAIGRLITAAGAVICTGAAFWCVYAVVYAWTGLGREVHHEWVAQLHEVGVPVATYGWYVDLAPVVAAALITVFAAVLAVLLRVRAPTARGAPQLIAFLTFLSLYVGLANTYWVVSGPPVFGGFSLVQGGAFFTVVNPFLVLALAALWRFSVVFPRPATEESAPSGRLQRFGERLRAFARRPRRLWASALGTAAAFVAVGYVLLPPGGSSSTMTSQIFFIPYSAGQRHLFIGDYAFHLGAAVAFVAAAVFLLMLIVGVGSAVHNLRVTLRTGTEEDRRQIYWIFQGLTAGGMLLAVYAAATLPLAFLQWAPQGDWMLYMNRPASARLAVNLALLVAVLFMAAAVFYRGAISPALMVRRTALTGGGATILVFFLAGFEALLSDWIIQRLALPQQTTTFLGAGLIAIGMTVMRRPLMQAANRILPSADRSTPLRSAPGGARESGTHVG